MTYNPWLLYIRFPSIEADVHLYNEACLLYAHLPRDKYVFPDYPIPGEVLCVAILTHESIHTPLLIPHGDKSPCISIKPIIGPAPCP